jgi:5-methylcytosine-specific restriction endonuclease McrA
MSTRPSRLLRDSARWFSEGARLKRDARLARRCVTCRTELPSRRSPYCSQLCQWRFQGGYFWDAARTYAFHRDRFTCQSCHRRYRRAQLEVDHIVEIARGGAPLDPANLQTLCHRCHREKTRAFLRGRGRSDHGLGEVSGRTSNGGAFDVADWFPS